VQVRRCLVGAAAVAVLVAASASSAPPPQTPPGFSDVYSFQPSWSRDGTRLALVRTFRPTSPSEIVVMNVDRSHARRIGVGFAPAWSPDGRNVVFVERARNEARYLTIAEADGSKSRRLLRIDANSADLPAWSPDGRLIAFRTDSNISVVRPDGRGLRILIRGAAYPDWSPDGQRLVFVTVGNLQCCHLEVAAVDGSGRRRLEGAEPRGGGEPRWSADGRRIAFVAANESGERSVYVMDADGTDAAQVTPQGFQHPTWAPDSKRLAVSSDDGEIYLVDLDGSVPRRLTFGGCTIVGTDASDVLVGRPTDDVICGFSGDDLIRGADGDDRIVGGAGNDRILGGPGRDTIFGENGDDVLAGGVGRDAIHGDAGRDLIEARDGERDLVDGGAGADRAWADTRD
jgi:Tol biopolymer transport system component